METANARWKMTDGRVTRVNHRPSVSYATVLCQAGKWPSYFDVVAFDDQRHGLKEGDAVTLSGELSMRKPKDGQGKYELQLVVRKYESGDDRKAPRPRGQEAPKASPESHEDPADDLLF